MCVCVCVSVCVCGVCVRVFCDTWLVDCHNFSFANGIMFRQNFLFLCAVLQ